MAIFIAILKITKYSTYLHDHIGIIFLFLWSLSISATGMTHILFKKTPKKFRRNYLIVITIRLLLAMFILGFAVYSRIYNLKTFVINYFIIYLVFVFFELFALKFNIGQNVKQ